MINSHQEEGGDKEMDDDKQIKDKEMNFEDKIK